MNKDSIAAHVKRENHYAILTHLKISYVFNNKINTTFLLISYILKKSCFQSGSKTIKNSGKILSPNIFLPEKVMAPPLSLI